MTVDLGTIIEIDVDLVVIVAGVVLYKTYVSGPKEIKASTAIAKGQELFMAGDYQRYNKMVNEALKEAASKDVEIDIEPLTEETFVKLMNSNDWTFDIVQLLGDILCE